MVRVYREKRGWTGPYRLLAIEGEIYRIELRGQPVVFRTIVVKPYYQHKSEDEPERESNQPKGQEENTDQPAEQPIK